MKNALTGRAALLGVAACMLATPSAIATTGPAASPARHGAPAVPNGEDGHGWIGSPPAARDPVARGAVILDAAPSGIPTVPAAYA